MFRSILSCPSRLLLPASLALGLLIASELAAVDLAVPFNQVHPVSVDTTGIAEMTSSGAPTAMIVGDFNCDGRADLAVGFGKANYLINNTPRAEAGAVVYALGSESQGLAQVWRAIRQGDNVASGVLEAGDQFGFALAAADFDGDGCDELAIGVPGEDTVQPVAENAGQVLVLRGAPSGLVGSGRRYLPPANSTGNHGVVAGHRKGRALATPRRLTNASQRPFLAIGAPNHNGFPVTDSGGVSIRSQDGSGMLLARRVAFRERFHVPDEAQRWGDIFGYRMVHGNFNGDSFDDLVVAMRTQDGCRLIGIPSFCIFNDGAVAVFYGQASASNLSGQLIHRDLPGVAGSSALFTFYGEALAVGDFDGDGFDDLVIGAPGQGAFGFSSGRGRVSILYGSPSGLLGALPRSRDFGLGALSGQSSADGDAFGAALAVGDFNADGFDDLAIAAPGLDNQRGRVLVIYGSANGLQLNNVTVLRNGLPGMPAAGNGQRFGSQLAAGDFNNDGAADLAIGRADGTVQMVYASSPTTMGAAVTPSPSVVGQSYRVTAVARRQNHGNALRARGQVIVQDDLGHQCVVSLNSNGTGSCNLPAPVAGTRTLTLSYPGTIGFQPASMTRTHQVLEAIPPDDELFNDRFEP